MDAPTDPPDPPDLDDVCERLEELAARVVCWADALASVRTRQASRVANWVTDELARIEDRMRLAVRWYTDAAG